MLYNLSTLLMDFVEEINDYPNQDNGENYFT